MRLLRLLLVAALACASPGLEAQTGRVAKLGILSTSAPPTPEQIKSSPFLLKLHELGWAEGRNLAIERRYVTSPALAQAARELAALKVDVVYAPGAPAIYAAKQEITAIPVVIFTVGDPVRSGFVKNLARPEGNLTGVAGFARDLLGKRVALLKETVPSLARLAVLGNPLQPMLTTTFRDMQERLRASGVEPRLYEVSNPAGLEPAFAAMARDKMQGLTEIPDPMIVSQYKKTLELVAKHKLPAIYENPSYVEAGGLMAYGPDYDDLARRCAEYVDKILRGAKPGDLPIELPTKFVMMVNLKAARELGIKVPQGVLLRADKVIE